jgi:nondiscriminating glutamyl-tRNA synthetase
MWYGFFFGGFMSEKSEVRVRFAPSPTGYLHVGGARTALFNYLFARNHGGKFILRIEDTDQARSTEESLKIIVQDLKWLGLDWDEGPDAVTLQDQGSYGPYYQSRRLDIYADYAQRLLEEGKAYYCFLTDEEIEVQREQAMKAGRPPQVQSPYEEWPLEKALAHMKESGAKGVVRFKTRHLRKDYVFHDLIRGEVKVPSDMGGDFVLLRSDGRPVYNFCCVVDDALMKISHVLRAEEHLPNTLRQLMIYEACGWKPPEFGHMSLILNEERQKLSKRHGAVSCGEFKELGYLPEALNNFLSLLGWSSPEGKEILSMEELQAQFSIDRLNPAGAVFDVKKFRWMNSVYLRALPEKELWVRVLPFLERAGLVLPKDPEWQERALKVFKTSMEVLMDAVELFRPISDAHFSVAEEAKEALGWETSKAVLQVWVEKLEARSEEFMSESDFLALQDEVKNQTGAKGKNLFMPLRVAVIGKPHGAELKILVPLLGRDSLIRRAQTVLKFWS